MRHTVELVSGVGAVFESGLGRCCVLRANVALKIEESGVAAAFTLESTRRSSATWRVANCCRLSM